MAGHLARAVDLARGQGRAKLVDVGHNGAEPACNCNQQPGRWNGREVWLTVACLGSDALVSGSPARRQHDT